MSDKELADLAKEVEAAQRRLIQKGVRDARKTILELAQRYNIDLATLKPDARLPGLPPAVKYVDPTDPLRTWSGIGRKPAWVVEALNKGKTLEDLQTKPTAK
jgi:DNA-binding protein H-NS